MIRQLSDEIAKSLYGRRGGARIRVSPPEDRTADGIVFDSKREMEVYSSLKALERAGTIVSLELQPRFPIVVNGVLVCTYVADFRYSGRDGRVTVNDAKGYRTEVYKLKKKLVEAQYGIRILET